MDCSLPGSSVRGILQARILEWVAIPFSRDLYNPGIELVSLVSPALRADPGVYVYAQTHQIVYIKLITCTFLYQLYLNKAVKKEIKLNTSLEKEMDTHSSILAWKIPLTEETGGLQFVGRKESYVTEQLSKTQHNRKISLKQANKQTNSKTTILSTHHVPLLELLLGIQQTPSCTRPLPSMHSAFSRKQSLVR